MVKHINNILQGVKTVKLEGEPKNTVVAFESNEAEMLECKLSGSLKLTGKVEIYMQTMIDKVRDEMLAQSQAAITDYKKTGVKSKGLPWLVQTGDFLRTNWLYNHIGQLCIVITQWAWTTRYPGLYPR